MRKRYAAEYKFSKLKQLDSLINSRQEGASLYQDELAREARQVKKQLNNTWRKRINKTSGNLWKKKSAKAFEIV